MTRDEALECLRDGHTIWTVESAKAICEAVGIEYDGTQLVKRFRSDPHPLGAQMRPGREGALGVWSLALGRYIAKRLGVADNAQSFLGRGTQAREYARVITEARAE